MFALLHELCEHAAISIATVVVMEGTAQQVTGPLEPKWITPNTLLINNNYGPRGRMEIAWGAMETTSESTHQRPTRPQSLKKTSWHPIFIH